MWDRAKCLDDLDHAIEIDWLLNNVDGAQCRHVVFYVADGAENHDGGAREFTVGQALLLFTKTPAIHDRHGQVEENHARTVFLQCRECLQTVFGADYFDLVESQVLLHHVAGIVVVFDN